MMHYTNDPVRDAEMYYDELEERLKHLPKCSWCGEPIQQEYAVYIDNCWYCDKCLDDNRREIEEW